MNTRDIIWRARSGRNSTKKETVSCRVASAEVTSSIHSRTKIPAAVKTMRGRSNNRNAKVRKENSSTHRERKRTKGKDICTLHSTLHKAVFLT